MRRRDADAEVDRVERFADGRGERREQPGAGRGLATLDQRMLIIADIERLMTGAEMALVAVH